jgi:hypothetical protein
MVTTIEIDCDVEFVSDFDIRISNFAQEDYDTV